MPGNAGQETNSFFFEPFAYSRRAEFASAHGSFRPLESSVSSCQEVYYVLTDAFSKYTELAAIEDKKAETVAKAFFESWICRHVVPILR